jgi:hypothetical protein
MLPPLAVKRGDEPRRSVAIKPRSARRPEGNCYARYWAASRPDKTRILTECCNVTGYHRKYALNAGYSRLEQFD